MRRALLRHRREAFHADGVDHDVVVLGALHLVLHGLGVAAEVERLVDSITQREDDAAALLEQELVDRPVDRVPQRRRPVSLQIAVQHLEQRIAVRREVVRLDDDVFAEVADAEPILREHAVDERFRGADLQLEVRLHAAAAVEQHDAGDRLDVVRENGQLLLDAVVVDFEVVAREVGHEAPMRVRDRRVDCDRARRGAERRRLLLRVRDGQRGRGHAAHRQESTRH